MNYGCYDVRKGEIKDVGINYLIIFSGINIYFCENYVIRVFYKGFEYLLCVLRMLIFFILSTERGSCFEWCI